MKCVVPDCDREASQCWGPDSLASGVSTVQCVVPDCDREASQCGGPDSLAAGVPQKKNVSGRKINIILQFILLTMKGYLTDCRIAENTNPLYFRHGRDETWILEDFFEFRFDKN